MGTHTIDKQFDFCYGHRVYTQRLNESLCSTGDTSTKCRHLHGHQGKVHVFVESDFLDDRGMCVDFKEMGWINDFLDTYLDHKFIIDINDPLYDSIVTDGIERALRAEIKAKGLGTAARMLNASDVPFRDVCIPGTPTVVGRRVDCIWLSKGSEREYVEGFFVVDFVPTSENLSKWLYDIVAVRMATIGAKVSRIDWWETPKSRASYTGE
jgi:6-pyruvoyltetrahydropterin/6-carboxytetrahydropterin synthase